MEMDKLCVVDHYPSDRFTFSSHGYDLHIENELVADAFAGLSVQEQSILILHFVLDLPDQEVGRLVGMSRSAVQRRRAKSLTELRIKLASLKLSTDYEAEQAGLQTQAAILREEIEEVEGKSANVDRFLSVVRQYTDIPELTPRILHEFVEKIVIHAATDPHSKINRRQEVDIYYKGIGILEMSKVFDSRQK